MMIINYDLPYCTLYVINTSKKRYWTANPPACIASPFFPFRLQMQPLASFFHFWFKSQSTITIIMVLTMLTMFNARFAGFRSFARKKKKKETKTNTCQLKKHKQALCFQCIQKKTHQCELHPVLMIHDRQSVTKWFEFFFRIDSTPSPESSSGSNKKQSSCLRAFSRASEQRKSK